MRLLLATLALAGALCAVSQAEAGRTRANAQWGGSDFAFSCEVVRNNRGWIEGMSADTRDRLAREFKITRKQRRQAMACLKGRD